MTNPNEVSLLPCPFCGKTSTLKVTAASDVFGDDEGFYEHTETYAVMCDASKPDGPGGCGADGGFKTGKAEAIAAWNTRSATSDAARLAYLINENAMVAEFNGRFWLKYQNGDEGKLQYRSAEDAIDAAIAA